MERRFRFTRNKLRDLVTSERLLFYDEGQDGLIIDVSGEVKSFRVYKKFDGRPVKITLGRFDPDMPDTRELPEGTKPIDLLGRLPALNVAIARKMAIAVIAQLDAGINPAQSRRRSRGRTLGDIFELYRTRSIDEGKKTAGQIAWYWQRYLGKLPEDLKRKKHGKERSKAPGGVNWQNRSLTDVTREDILRLRSTLKEKVGRTTARHVVALVRALYNFAKREDLYAGENPAGFVLRKFNLESRKRYLRTDEAAAFFAALEKETDRDFADYVLLSLYTGARRGNVLRMRAQELALEGAEWNIPGEKMKAGEAITIPLISEAVEILKARVKGIDSEKNPQGWIFPGDTPEGHHGPFRAQWERFSRDNKFKGLRIHDLRRSLGSWMAAGGTSTTITMSALGHKSLGAAMIYQRLAVDPVRNAMQQAVASMKQKQNGGQA